MTAAASTIEYVCSFCGSSYTTPNEDDLCEVCIKDTCVCEHCGKRIDNYSNDTFCVGNETWCTACYDNDSVTCAVCGDQTPQEDAHLARLSHSSTSVYVCDGCRHDSYEVFRCDCCGSLIQGDSNEVAGDHYVCDLCRRDHYYYCEHCDAYAHEDDPCCSDDDDDDNDNSSSSLRERDPSWRDHPGTDFSRFSDRFVGLEIEIACGRSNYNFQNNMQNNLPSWGVKDDGSLPDGGCEFVSPKISGDRISTDYMLFVKLAREAGLDIQHYQAGYHVHVDGNDLYSLLAELYSQDYDSEKASVIEDVIVHFGQVFTRLTMEFVSKSRRENRFCRGEFATRAGYHPVLKKMPSGGGAYPCIAVRDHTFEFRIFPSTNNPAWHLARIEFAQKAVDWLWKVVNLPLAKMNKALVTLDKMTNTLYGEERITKLAHMLRLSKDSTTTLKQIHKKYQFMQYRVPPSPPVHATTLTGAVDWALVRQERAAHVEGYASYAPEELDVEHVTV